MSQNPAFAAPATNPLAAAADSELSRRQAAVVALGRRAVSLADSARLAHDGAALVAETLDVDYFAVAELTGDGRSFTHRFAENARNRESDDRFDEYQTTALASQSLAGFALAGGRPLIVDDLAQEHRSDDLFLRSRGVRSALVIPLQFQQQPYGALGVFSREPHKFSPHDVLFVETISHQITATIARDRTAAALSAEQSFTSTLLQTVDALVLVMNETGRILRINGAFEQISGFAQKDFVDRTFWSALLVADEVGIVKAAFTQLEKCAAIDFESYILTRQGERRRIAWSFAKMHEEGEIRLLGTGVDVTQLRQTEDELRRMHTVASNSTRELNELLSKVKRGELAVAPDAAPLGRKPFQEVPLDEAGERRTRPRRSYPYIQLMAPILHGVLPDRRAFREIRCREIAASGFSYLTPTRPNYEDLVVALGVAPALTYVRAKVVHVTQSPRSGKEMYTVGCVYRGRAEY